MCRTTVTPRAPTSTTQAEPFGVLRLPTSAWHTSPCVHSTVPAPVVARSGITSARATPSASAGSLLHRDTEGGAERLDGLNTADVRARQDPAHGYARERRGQRRRLPPAAAVERPQAIVAIPFRADAGGAMADEHGQHAATR